VLLGCKTDAVRVIGRIASLQRYINSLNPRGPDFRKILWRTYKKLM